jgi:P-type Mg2+ transporter
VIFAIRTRRIPFFRSHPSVPLLLAALGAITVGALLPATPLARTLGFQPLPGLFFVALALMAASYLVLIEIGKRWFYRTTPAGPAIRHRNPGYRLLRRAARFTTADSLPDRSRAAESSWPAADGARTVKLRPAQPGGQPAPSAGRCDADAS